MELELYSVGKFNLANQILQVPSIYYYNRFARFIMGLISFIGGIIIYAINLNEYPSKSAEKPVM